MTDAPVLSILIAKILTLADRILNEWVMLDIQEWYFADPGLDYVNNCHPSGRIIGNMTACGDEFVEHLEDMIHSGVVALGHILGGLVSVFTQW